MLLELLDVPERPSITAVHEALGKRCRGLRIRPPSRATIYNALDRVEPPLYDAGELPPSVQACLHNVGKRNIPGAQVVFAAMNYGEPRALSFAAGMPWPCLRRASMLPGFRPKSLALLRAILVHRGI